MNINVIGSSKLTYLACRGEALNDGEDEYAQTWLHKHHLTMLEKVVSVEGEVCEDNEDTTVEGEVCKIMRILHFKSLALNKMRHCQ